MEEEKGIVKLVSKEGSVHEVPLAVAKMSVLVASTIEEEEEDDEDEEAYREIPLVNVMDVVLTKVIEFCRHHTMVEPMTSIQTPLKSSKIEDLVQPWYAEFVKIELSLLFELVTAANFMDIKPLLDLTCLYVSVSIKGKTAAEMRTIFNISNEFSAEEEAQVREESQWQQSSSNNDGPK
mmetsp:Transcript_17085/g.37349  ORF Transcript_17085/g.37349 Transcript_17085/m.37349 type:complete len:179 (+) Transcript_17085:159-695(+)